MKILEEGAEATLLAESTSFSPESGGLHCGGVELIVAPGAHLRFVSLQDWGFGVWHFAQQKALVDKDASLQWTMAAMGSKLAKEIVLKLIYSPAKKTARLLDTCGNAC